MPDFGNLLTTEDSTPWSPFQRNVNAFMSSHITASAPNYSNQYKRHFVTGSTSIQTNEYAKALGAGDQRFIVGLANKGWLMNWAENLDPDGDGSITFDLDEGVGRTEALDSFIIQSGNNSAFAVGGYAISASNDASSWTGLTSSIYYPVASGNPPSAGYDATMIITNNTAYRYYKIMLLDVNGTYGGISGIVAWDSSLFLDQLNLFNPSESNVTASFVEVSSTDLEKFTSPPRENYGIYFTEKIGSMDLFWGDGEKLIRGWAGVNYSSTTYVAGITQFYKSKTGETNSWELFHTTNITDTQGPAELENYFIEFGTPVKTQYLRIVFYGEGSTAPNQTTLMYNGWMYQMLSASAPPAPTNLTTGVSGNNVLLKWSQNSGSDNRLVDLIYNVERSSDGGSNYTRITTLSGSVIQDAFTASMGIPTQTNYVDTGVSDGSYIYRIQAQNRHHLTTGSFATSETLAAPPATKKIFVTNKGNTLINPNDTILIELD